MTCHAIDDMAMQGRLLPKPSCISAAKQCREMGIQVGDTIIGREDYDGGWNEAKLTLIFAGEQVAVFKVMCRNSTFPEWQDDGESGSWRLNHRDWYMMTKDKS